ncbi:hypothetical protein PsorP6_016442 [Peronosclerospora sorghi]|uniref:Uncharacterized protein n=1 Tax=Peronosclerospora sorghi TaxID=230839 RepID=A0ACC0VK46_9STRA|nr:hypothetical protein PsorP6_016442 [Peronosclerospora sorghi]
MGGYRAGKASIYTKYIVYKEAINFKMEFGSSQTLYICLQYNIKPCGPLEAQYCVFNARANIKNYGSNLANKISGYSKGTKVLQLHLDDTF